MKQSNQSTIQHIAMIIAFIVFGTGLIMSALKPAPEQKPIQFEVTGVTGSVNSSTLVGIHYECIKYCVSQTGNKFSNPSSCWDQCEKLGKEECNK
jgi:hypothetical protein